MKWGRHAALRERANNKRQRTTAKAARRKDKRLEKQRRKAAQLAIDLEGSPIFGSWKPTPSVNGHLRQHVFAGSAGRTPAARNDEAPLRETSERAAMPRSLSG